MPEPAIPANVFVACAIARNALRHACMLLLLSCAIVLASPRPAAAEATTAPMLHAQAARSDWNSTQPPSEGWVDVTLPDDWSRRWKNYDGVVWYRLAWQQSPPLDDIALYLEYLTMAGEIRVNGAVIERDANLVEPLSRMWNVPRYWLLSPPLLREGENSVLVRVSGLAQYSPGLGPTQVGAAAPLRERFESARLMRQELGFVGMAIDATVGLFFLVLWLLRRSEVAYGWYGASRLAWFPVAWNVVATSPWPFASTDAWQNLIEVAVPLYSGAWAMFVLRFCGRRWPRREAAMWLVLALASLWIVLAPHDGKHAARDLANLIALLVVGMADVLFLWFAWRGGRTDQRILSLFAAAIFGAGVHDVLAVAGVILDTTNYGTLTSHVTVIGVALVLAWNFVRNLRRIEGFNAELQRNVDEARGELASTLTRQHDLELVHARLGERVSLAHDLHDGLGGMLIGNIAQLEQAPEQMSSRKALSMLQELRDDLRLIIDTAAAQHYGEHSLAQLLAPLRHRMTRLFEAHAISARWSVQDLDRVYLTTTQSLDLLRILQEALANVLKHADARRVDVTLRNDDAALLLEVRDDGNGLGRAADASGHGTGMRSMQARARRLGAALSVAAENGATVVRLQRPWPVAGAAAPPVSA